MKVQQRVAGEPVVKAEVFWQIADAPPSFRVTRRFAEEARVPARRFDQTEQDLDGRGFARAVWAQEAEDLTGLDYQVQPVKCDLATVLLAEADRLESGFRCGQRTARLSAMGFRSMALSEPATPYR
jgi:hypothetical protein